MRMKRFAVILIAALLLVQLCVPGSQAAPTDTVYVRKHVSLVYDNSGSMSMEIPGSDNLKWTYASYAAQVFAGLLNDTDTLTMTFMNPTKSTQSLEVDLKADRQAQVDRIFNATNYANGGTPFESVTDAKEVLLNKGLLSDSQVGDNQINMSEQFWLVLTTDGHFDYQSSDDLISELETLLMTYSNLQVVYFGIGTEGDNSDQAAYDLRNCQELKAYPNFTPVYAEKQEQIVSTMQELANRISGRYSVSDGVKFDGNEVTLRISGETSPIRNVALLAQETDAQLLGAEDENGNPLTIARSANVNYPHNSNYDNLPDDIKGGHIALITCPDGKFPPGTVKLTFSEPVSQNGFSLMYEPAVYVKLIIESKDASGNWVEVPYGQKVNSGSPMRVSYSVCEDGTDTPIEPSKLPGVTTEQITCGDVQVGKGSEFQAPAEATTITATVSMMDGAYTVSTSRNLQVISLQDYTFEVSDALSFYPNELDINTTQYIEFKVLYQGKAATGNQLADFTVDGGSLQGTLTTPKDGVFRFTPKQANCAPGDYPVNLTLSGQTVASQNVTVKEMVTSYTAEAGDGLVLLSNEVAANTKPIVFQVTCIRGNEKTPLAQEDAGLFQIKAVNAEGVEMKGVTTYEAGGQLHFVANDPDAPVSDYTVSLYWQDQVLASAQISILKYNAQYTAEVFLTGENTLNRLNLRNNTNALAFVIYADGEPCTGVQLQNMIGQQLLLQTNPDYKQIRLQMSVSAHDGKPALIVCPTTAAGNVVADFFQTLQIVCGAVRNGPLAIALTVQAEKGTQVTGTLEITHDPAEMLKWILILIAVVACLVILTLMILCNLHKPRIARGDIYYYKLIKKDSRYVMLERNSTPIKWRLCFLNPAPERRGVCGGITVQAPADDSKRRLICPPANPEVIIKVTGRELDNYYSRAESTPVRNFLAMLQRTPNGSRLQLAQIDSQMPTSPLGAGKKAPEPGRTEIYSAEMESGGFLARKIGKDTIEFWAYFPKGSE